LVGTEFFSTRAKWRFLKSECRITLLTTPTLSEIGDITPANAKPDGIGLLRS
jgi:hypothetical protein